MNTHIKSLLFIFTLSMILPTTSVFAEDQVYGWQMMSERERNEYHTKMQSMNTEAEKNRYRLEHHKLMEQRAAKQGKTLSDMPQKNMDVSGSGGGMGSGGGGGGGRK